MGVCMGYIMDLRKIVGHRTLLQLGASVIIEDSEGRILLQKRTDNHTWSYAGGSVEPDESVEEAACRECEEETGLIPDELVFLGIYSGKHMHYIYPNGDEVSNVDVVFICRKWHGTMKKQEEEVEELRFFAKEELPENIFFTERQAVQDWKEGKA